MTTPQQSRADLAVVTGAAVGEAQSLFDALDGSPEVVRAGLLDGVPGVIEYYATGAGVLATDFYDERRSLAKVKQTYVSEVIINDRTVKIRRAVAWSTEPLFAGRGVTEADMAEVVRKRLAEVVQPEVANVYRDTITGNADNDPACIGWQRITYNCCKFCRFLADRGAVYKASKGRFAAHAHCDCSAAPVFVGSGMQIGPQASPEQYVASLRKRTPKQQEGLRALLEAMPD